MSLFRWPQTTILMSYQLYQVKCLLIRQKKQILPNYKTQLILFKKNFIRTPISRKSMKLSSNVNKISATCQSDCNNPREKEVMAERQSTYKDSKKSILFRTPSLVRTTQTLYSEPRNQSIIPSIEKSSPVPWIDNSYNCRTMIHFQSIQFPLKHTILFP